MKSKALAAALLSSLILLVPTAGASPADWRWPVAGKVITPYRNGPDPYAGGQHRGIDIAAAAGSPVVAAVGGSVTFAGLAGSSGLTVSVRTADGRLDTSYLHLSSIGVRAGDSVAAGYPLGAVGTTGRRSASEPHLHFGVRDAGTRYAYRDPMDFLPPPSAAPDPARRPVSVPVDVPLPVLPALAAIPALPLALPAMGVPGLVADGARGQLAAGGAPSPHAASAPSGAGPSPAFAGLLAGTRPRTVGVRRSGPVGRPAGAQAVRDHRVPAVSQHPLVGPAAGARGGTGGRRAAGAPLHGSRVAGSRPPRPIDAGWLAACLGLVAAAMLLGRPPGPTAGVRRAWTFLAAARPSSERG